MTQDSGLLALVVIIYILAFIMAYTVGANDAANSLASSYGTRAAKLWVLLIGGALFEWVGAYWCSG
jgi:phosphate/sulfate permease